MREVLSYLQEGAEADQGEHGAAAGTALPGSTPAPLQGQEFPNKRQKVASLPVLRDGEVRHPPRKLYHRRPGSLSRYRIRSLLLIRSWAFLARQS